MRLPIVAVAALTFAFAGPRLTSARSHAANAPFLYEPPEGFVEARDLGKSLEVKENAKAWALRDTPNGWQRPSVNQSHSTKELPVEEEELSKLAQEMPKAFEDSGCTWTHRRHEMRVRTDGARVGLIEGDCNQELDLSRIGAQTVKVKLRKLQLIFPDDAGTSIVTASYPTEEASKWEPVFEATIARAHGVATRVPPTAPWLYGAWGGAGAILGWLLAALVKKKDEPKATQPAAATKANKKPVEDVNDDDDDDE